MAKGIGAHSAKDPRGLDAVVTDAIAAAASDVSSNIEAAESSTTMLLLSGSAALQKSKCGATSTTRGTSASS